MEKKKGARMFVHSDWSHSCDQCDFSDPATEEFCRCILTRSSNNVCLVGEPACVHFKPKYLYTVARGGYVT